MPLSIFGQSGSAHRPPKSSGGQGPRGAIPPSFVSTGLAAYAPKFKAAAIKFKNQRLTIGAKGKPSLFKFFLFYSEEITWKISFFLSKFQ